MNHGFKALLTVLALSGINTVFAADNVQEVELKAPLLVCHELAGGVRPPGDAKSEPEHDLIFFVLAGRNADGTEIRQVAPQAGGHLKIDNQSKSMIIKDVPLWKGTLKDGETVTFALSVREQDGKDSAEADLAEAAEIAPKIDNAKKLPELAHIPVHEILHGEKGENDHIGTILVRIKNVAGKITFDSELGADAKYLKGHASNHYRTRAYKLVGDHANYDLHLSIGD
jgi:hypothetical protein